MSSSLRGTLLAVIASVGCGASSSGSDGIPGAGGVYQVIPAASGGITATVVANGGFFTPRDAVPTSDGMAFYFVGTTESGAPGVFGRLLRSTTLGPILASGAPLKSPLGISIATDDKTLYIADPAAGIFQMPVVGGTPQLLAGTDCMKPRGLDVVRRGGADVIYFSTGAGACGGGAGLASVPASGGSPGFVAMGAAFAVPTGVAVAPGGEVYVSNPAMDAYATGSILKVSGRTVSQLVGDLRFGHPAGIALDQAASTLFASGRDDTGHDLVYAITLPSQAITTFNTTIGMNTDAGGLHRAAAANVFAWADTTLPPRMPIPGPCPIRCK